MTTPNDAAVDVWAALASCEGELFGEPRGQLREAIAAIRELVEAANAGNRGHNMMGEPLISFDVEKSARLTAALRRFATGGES